MSSRRLVNSVRHGVLLYWNLGLRRFSIVVVYWMLRRYRPAIATICSQTIGTANHDDISRDPVLMYQMPKVGSTSLLYSLQFAYLKAGLPNVMLHHVHTLTNLDLHEQIAAQSDNPAQQLALIREYKKIRQDIESQSEGHWTAISMIRDPIARQISDYFHNIDHHMPGWRKRWNDRTLSVDEVLRHFLTLPDHTPNWFEAEVQSVLGIDVYSSAFPHEAGYIVCREHPKVKLMVMRLEDMNRVAGQAIEELLGIQEFKVRPFNVGNESAYRELYKQFKTKPLPDWYVEKEYSSKLARHFYSDAERDRFAKKWTSGCPA